MQAIKKIEEDREARRQKAQDAKMQKNEKAKENAALGRNKTDVDFDILIEE